MLLFWGYKAFWGGKKGLIRIIAVRNISYNANFRVKKRDKGQKNFRFYSINF